MESIISQNKKENNINNYLLYSINLYNEYLNLYKKINESISYHSNYNELDDYFLVDKKYINEIESILHFQEIKNIINKNKEKFNNNNKDILKELRNNLLEDTLNDLGQFNKEKIETKLNDIPLYKLKQSFINNDIILYYYRNCQILNQQIYNFLKKYIDKNINSKIIPIKCVFDKGEAIVFINSEIINVGHIIENRELIIDYLIKYYNDKTSNTYYLNKIFNVIKLEGYKFIEHYLSYGFILFNINKIQIEAKIYKLSEENKININNYYNISEKLKTLIFLSINQLIDFNNTNKNNNKIEKVFLLNNILLINYKYNEIKSLIHENNEIKNLIYNTDYSNLYDDSNVFNTIISKLNQDKLKDIDNYISNVNSLFSIEAQPIYLELSFDKKIKIFTDFILVKVSIYKLFKVNFSSTTDITRPEIYYTYKDGDIITINDILYPTILFGNIDKRMNHYEIKYIFTFGYDYPLNEELNNITKYGIKEYISKKTVFSNINEKDYMSPIFKKNKIIGYCYKYIQNYNYNDCINYEKFLSNDKLTKVLELYSNYFNISKKINENNIFDYNITNKKYYLINKELSMKIKKDYNYKAIKKMLDENKFNDNQYNNKNKILLSIIKNLPIDTLNNFFQKTELNNKYENEQIEPNIIPVINPNNSENSIMIYDNFEIFEEESLKLFINIFYIGQNNLEYNFGEGKIIIHYDKIHGNKNYISVIGTLDNDNTFIKEYIFIYNDFNERYYHMNNIKGKLINYLNSLKFYNNTHPITKDEYKEIGLIIKFDNNNINTNSNNINFQNNNNINHNIITQNNNNQNNNNHNTNIKTNSINNNFYYNKHINENIGNKKINNDIGSYNIEPKDNSNKISKYKNISEIEYNLNTQKKAPLQSNFAFPPLIGLQNIGATCYMNATLQCFCHIEKFINFFKYSHQIIDLVKADKNKLSSSFKLLIEKLWPDNYDDPYLERNYAPKEFKEKISSMNSLFEGVAASDAKNFVNFIIITLHEELNKADKNSIINNNIILDQTNQQLMFTNFVKTFTSQNKSIISDLFYAMNCNIIQCDGCGIQTFNYQTYFFIVFPLEKVSKFKYNQFNNNIVNIYDCFDYHTKINVMSGANSMYCKYCKRNCNSSMCTLLTTGPEILILLLNRGKGIEFNIKILFTEDLNLLNYIQLNNTGFNYKLIGVISHLGENETGGYFIAYCKDPISKEWHKYNDSSVTAVNNFQNEVISQGMPCLLFYQKKQ